MTPQEIIEGNKLIAEFCQFQETKIGWFDSESVLSIPGSNTFDELLFNSSWDWLMCVVEKIESLGFYFNIKKNHVVVARDNKDTRDSEMIHSEWCDQSKIERVFQCAVAFVKYCNQNKATKTTEHCPNCKETKQPCACMRNICHKCGEPVGNITFTVCDDCWDKNQNKS